MYVDHGVSIEVSRDMLQLLALYETIYDTFRLFFIQLE